MVAVRSGRTHSVMYQLLCAWVATTPHYSQLRWGSLVHQWYTNILSAGIGRYFGGAVGGVGSACYRAGPIVGMHHKSGQSRAGVVPDPGEGTWGLERSRRGLGGCNA